MESHAHTFSLMLTPPQYPCSSKSIQRFSKFLQLPVATVSTMWANPRAEFKMQFDWLARFSFWQTRCGKNTVKWRYYGVILYGPAQAKYPKPSPTHNNIHGTSPQVHYEYCYAMNTLQNPQVNRELLRELHGVWYVCVCVCVCMVITCAWRLKVCAVM